jgi:putative hemolysin
VLVGVFFISAALLLICGLVALEVALVEARRAFIPQNYGQENGSAASEGQPEESSVPVSDFILASRIIAVILLVFVGGVAGYFILGAVGGTTWTEEASRGHSPTGVVPTCIVAFSVFVFAIALGFILPQFLGARFRESALKYLAPLGRLVVRMTWPAIATARFARQLAIRGEGAGAVEEEAIEDDIRSLVEEGERAGVIEEEERQMITRVFRLGDKPIASLMTSRSDVVFLDVGMTVAQAVKTALDSRLTWFPVRQGIDDDVIGIVSVHDVFELQADLPADAQAQLRGLSSPAMDVPESMTALELLERFKEQGEHFAVVRDEYGSVAGIATVDDVLQVVVGDMGEVNGEGRSITVRDDGSLLVDASLDVQNLFETLGCSEASDGEPGQFHSVGGFVMSSLGRIPKAGDSFMHDGHRFEVVDMDGKRIDKILVVRLASQRAVGD